MDEKEFYLETIKKIPAISNQTAYDSFFEFLQLQHLYNSAIDIVTTQLNILDNEFSVKFKRNPIHNIENRLKSPQSIIGKLKKKGLPLTTESAKKNLLDMAGIRVICYYVNDIYSIAELLTCHDEFVPIKIKDYIKNPKASGYRSYHMILNIQNSMLLLKFRYELLLWISGQVWNISSNIRQTTQFQRNSLRNSANVLIQYHRQMKKCRIYSIS